MIRLKNSKYSHLKGQKNIFDHTSKETNKLEENLYVEDFISNKDQIVSKIREINSNIEVLGKLCDRKKQRSFEEYSSVLNSNKAAIEEELNKIRFKLVDALKNSTREDLLKKLQKDFTDKKNLVYDTDKDLQRNNKLLYEYEHKHNKLKEENKFLNQEIKNSLEYQLFLKNKLKELQEVRIEKSSSLNVSDNNFEIQNNNSSIIKTSEKNYQNKNVLKKIEKYFNKNEEMIKQKLNNQEKIFKEKYNTYKNLNNFKNPVLENFKNIIKQYQIIQVNQMSDKVTNEEVFFNNSINDLSKISLNNAITMSQFNSYKNKKLENKLTAKDKKDIIKKFLEDYEIKSIIFSYLYKE